MHGWYPPDTADEHDAFVPEVIVDEGVHAGVFRTSDAEDATARLAALTVWEILRGLATRVSGPR